MTKIPVKIGLVEDHILLRDALATQIDTYEGFSVSLLADNGMDFIEKLNPTNKPDILLLDLSMPVMDGHDTIKWLSKNHPDIKILLLTLFDAESVIHLIKGGVRGFIKKDSHPGELKTALQSVMEKGSYCSQTVTSRLFNLMQNHTSKSSVWGAIVLNDKEVSFLKLVATEMTYREMALKMEISHRTIDNYRDALFLKLNVKSRIGLAMYAVKSGIVTVNY
jgi:two-component system, NarL family, invasion response regulator UvrY